MSLILLDTDSGSGASRDLDGTSTGVAAVSAALKVAHALVASTCTGVCAVTAVGRVAKALASAQEHGVCTVTSALTVASAFAGTITGVCTVSAQLKRDRPLSCTVTGTCTVAADLTDTQPFRCTVTGVCTVSASLFRNRGLAATVPGTGTTSPSLSVLHRLVANTSTGAGTVTVGALNTRQPLSGTTTGVCTVNADLHIVGTRELVGDTSVGVATVTGSLEVIDLGTILGILMLIDPTYATELASTPFNSQTFGFVKKVVKGLYYVDIVAVGAVLTCQVKTGDGIAYEAVVNIAVRTIASGTGTITVNVGNTIAGSGTNICWLQTTSTGAFQVTIGGSGDVLVEMTPRQGVVMSIPLVI